MNPKKKAQAKLPTELLFDRVIAVVAPPGWEKLSQKDPEGPEIQAFLNGVLKAANRAKKRGSTSAKRVDKAKSIQSKAAGRKSRSKRRKASSRKAAKAPFRKPKVSTRQKPKQIF